MRGRYVALEGIEGAGKSTITELLSDALSGSGRSVVVVREPGGTPVGERIRSVLLDGRTDLGPWTEALLFAASRAQLVRDVIGPALDDGEWVVGDRSVYSSLAYQGGGRGLGVPEVRTLNQPGLVGVWPDLVVLLRVDPRTGLERQTIQDRIGMESREFLARVGRTFDALAASEPNRIAVVDASLPLDRVVTLVIREIDDRWPSQ